MGGLELDGTKVTILMVAGGVFAAFALFLLVRPPAHGVAKIELFGLKFESGSAAILVFLVGVALLSLPLWVNETSTEPAPAPGLPPAQNPEPAPKPAATPPVETPPANNSALLLPAEASAKESEPNNSVQSANQVPLGTTVSARSKEVEPDWFVMDLRNAPAPFVEISVRHVSGYNFDASVYDSNEKHLGDFRGGSGVERVRFPIDENDRIYLRVHSFRSVSFSDTRYEVFYDFVEHDFDDG